MQWLENFWAQQSSFGSHLGHINMRFLHLAIFILAFTQVAWAQDEPAEEGAEGAEGDDAAKEEECEEAWEYLEFLKSEIK